MKKVENFFILYHTMTYVENSVYDFVVFRLKSAGCSNYRGATFLPRANIGLVNWRIRELAVDSCPFGFAQGKLYAGMTNNKYQRSSAAQVNDY